LDKEGIMYRYFEQEIEDVKNRIINMSIYVEEMIFNSIISLKDFDKELARKIIEKDDFLDKTEIEIEEKLTEIILRHHPLAGDLRFVLASLKINNDLERIGDLAVDICWRVIEMSTNPDIKVIKEIEKMKDMVVEMLSKSIKSLSERNYELAKEVVLGDSKIDEMRNQISKMLLEDVSNENAKNIFLTILIVRHLERIADHCVNIAEDIIYILQSKIIRHHNEEI
jgi:phosphate transport system protein